MATQIKIGSIVKLNGGESPVMNVNNELENNMLECVWFNGDILKNHTFHKSVLYNMVDYKFTSEEFAKMSNEELLRIASWKNNPVLRSLVPTQRAWNE
ncbi:MAG: hypothetical protein J0647_10005 [Campylobacteraceae bacterium]|nr:hypothetical protein [Campylobacteraceae bacterium]